MASEPTPLVVWVQAALFGTEIALEAIKWWWVLAALLFLTWLVSGVFAAKRGGYQGAASVATGRLGFFASLGSFVMLTMAVWALLSTVLELSVAHIGYTPSIFPASEVARAESVAAQAAAACLWNAAAGAAATPLGAEPAAATVPVAATVAAVAAVDAGTTAAAPATPPPSSAQVFLRTRYEDSTSFFSLVAALLILLVLYLAAMFLPSILAELKLLRGTGAAAARRLGQWLTAGYRKLDGAVLAVVAVGIVFATAVGYVLKFGQASLAASPPLAEAMDCAAFVSQSALKPLVLSAAGIAAALTALGGLLSRYVPGLRAPLDIALDVDNYFREFPRKAIPRARIFSRYKALLDHIAQQGYERIVIVSHSQGTVISAEMLRFLSSAFPGQADDLDGRRRRLSEQLGGNVRLLTLGCPLRQLYAARFPSLYPWVLAAHPGGNGPEAADIGVERWANAFTSGDYVGRWLWSSPTAANDALGHPMTDTLHPPSLGRGDAYSSFDPMPPATASLAGAREFEVCIGLGAHTHYFEPDQRIVAWLIDHLIA